MSREDLTAWGHDIVCCSLWGCGGFLGARMFGLLKFVY